MPRIIKPVAKGDFTSATIAVDSSGRIFSAASGSAGGGAFVPKVFVSGPASGTLASNAGFIGAYLYAGGGGGGGGTRRNQVQGTGGTGGDGGFGFYGSPVSAPFSQPYSVGGGGAGGAGGTGTVAPNPNPVPGDTGAAGLALIYQNTGA